MKIEFPDEGVTFIFPKALEHIFVKNLGPPKYWPNDPKGVFKPAGFVMQFELQDPATGKKPELGGGFTIIVKFKQKHLDSAGGFSNLQLGIHNGSGWINKTSKSEKKQHSKAYKSKWRGYFKVKIKDWADPAMGWGP